MRGLPHHSRRLRTPQEEAVCLLVRAEARAGADEEVARLLAELAEGVRADEPACTSYVVTRMMGSSTHFAVHARFVSWHAFNAHAETPHLTHVLPRLTALLATPISMELFLEVPTLRRPISIDDARRKVEAQRHRE
jgi:quinol monooxygenase YgiN